MSPNVDAWASHWAKRRTESRSAKLTRVACQAKRTRNSPRLRHGWLVSKKRGGDELVVERIEHQVGAVNQHETNSSSCTLIGLLPEVLRTEIRSEEWHESPIEGLRRNVLEKGHSDHVLDFLVPREQSFVEDE